jgi:hypothetical protein
VSGTVLTHNHVDINKMYVEGVSLEGPQRPEK